MTQLQKQPPGFLAFRRCKACQALYLALSSASPDCVLCDGGSLEPLALDAAHLALFSGWLYCDSCGITLLMPGPVERPCRYCDGGTLQIIHAPVLSRVILAPPEATGGIIDLH